MNADSQPDPGRLPLGLRLVVVARSAWIQASLNESGMLNLGRLFALTPVARWLGLSGDAWRAFVGRHAGVFYSNPFVATLGLGALARVEVDAARAGSAPPDGLVERFSARLSTPLGAVGDELFWSAVRPKMAYLGVLTTILWGVWGVGVFIVGFSVWQYTVRWKTFGVGWRLGLNVAESLRGPMLRKPARIAGAIAAGAAGAVAPLAAGVMVPRLAGSELSGAIVAVLVCAAVLGFAMTRLGRAPVWALAGGTVSAAVASAVSAVAG